LGVWFHCGEMLKLGNRSNQPQQTGVELMKRFTTILLAIAVGGMLVSLAIAKDTGSRDALRLSDARLEEGEWKVAVFVINDQELAALDIPIRYGQSGDGIELLRVDFANMRLASWDFTHAQIDNEAKTVIIGAISELVGTRESADLKVATRGVDSKIADLVFRVDEGFVPEFTTFTTKSPGHELTFLYNEDADGHLTVRSYVPEFEVDVEGFAKSSVLPSEYALSQNFPNPFNPSTAFSLSLPEASDYSIRVFNVAGQLVKTFDGHAEAGVHEVIWHGDNNQGSKVASGVYFYRAEASGFTETRKMMLLK